MYIFSGIIIIVIGSGILIFLNRPGFIRATYPRFKAAMSEAKKRRPYQVNWQISVRFPRFSYFLLLFTIDWLPISIIALGIYILKL